MSNLNKLTRRSFLAGSAALTAIAAGQMTAPRRVSAQNRVINLYSSRHYDTDQALYDSFTQRTGITVNLVEAEADPLIERIKSEGANSPADVLITVDAGRLWKAKQAGILLPINSPVLQRAVPAPLRDPDNMWFGFSTRARVIMYNKERVNPATLSTYEALTDARWRGKILTRSSTNIYSVSWTASMLAAHNASTVEDWSRGLVANFARPPEGNDIAQIRACAAGTGDLAISNTYYLARMAKSSDPADRAVADKIGIFFPNQRDRGTHVNISGGGVVKTAPNPQGAQLFLEHLVSSAAQRAFADGNNEYPVVAGVPLDPVLQAYGTYRPDSVNLNRIGELSADASQVMDRAGWK